LTRLWLVCSQAVNGSVSREWNSEAYNRLSDPQFGFGRKVVQRLARRAFRGDELVLDAGCGTGRVTGELISMFPRGRVVGVDLSENMLHAAKENLSGFGDRVRLVCGNLSRLPFSAAFDGVFSTATLHWITDHVFLFRSIYLVLNPGGWLLAQCGGAGNLRTVRERARRLQADSRFAQYFEEWTEPWVYEDDATTAAQLQEVGFIDIRTWLEQAPVTLNNATEYREFLATVTLHKQLATIENSRLRDEFLDSLVADAEEQGCFLLDYVRLNIEANKPER
jgi:trans-aconitate 2-methyltransferase